MGDVNFGFRASEDLLSSLMRRVTGLERNLDVPQPWVPILRAYTTPPSYSASGVSGQYIRRPGHVEAWFTFTFSSFSPGSGSYYLEFPWAASPPVTTGQKVLGEWWGQQAATGYTDTGLFVHTVGGIGQVGQHAWFWRSGFIAAANSVIHAGYPWAWANGDQLTGHLSIPTTPGY